MSSHRFAELFSPVGTRWRHRTLVRHRAFKKLPLLFQRRLGFRNVFHVVETHPDRIPSALGKIRTSPVASPFCTVLCPGRNVRGDPKTAVLYHFVSGSRRSKLIMRVKPSYTLSNAGVGRFRLPQVLVFPRWWRRRGVAGGEFLPPAGTFMRILRVYGCSIEENEYAHVVSFGTGY